MDDKTSWWLGGGGAALLVTIVIAFLGYMRNPPFIRASRVKDMRDQLEELMKHAERCDRQLLEMRDENQWLLQRLRRLEDRMDRKDTGNP